MLTEQVLYNLQNESLFSEDPGQKAMETNGKSDLSKGLVMPCSFKPLWFIENLSILFCFRRN